MSARSVNPTEVAFNLIAKRALEQKEHSEIIWKKSSFALKVSGTRPAMPRMSFDNLR